MRFRFHLFTVLFLLIATASFAQTKNDLKDSTMQAVRSINQTPGMERVEAEGEYNWQSEKTPNRLVGFFKDDALLKIVDYAMNSKGHLIEEYYFKNDDLIYVHQWFYSDILDKITGQKTNSSVQTFDGQYFLQGGKLTDRDETGTAPFEDDGMTKESVLFQNARKDIQILRNAKR